MAKFEILTGAKLGKAINARGAAIATFKEREHQLAYSALNHVEMHGDPKYLNALLEITPANYRAGLVKWSVAYGKVTFDPKALTFAPAMKKKSDLEAAMQVAPADYTKESKGKKTATFNEVKAIQRLIDKCKEEGVNSRTIAALEGVLKVAAGPVLVAAA